MRYNTQIKNNNVVLTAIAEIFFTFLKNLRMSVLRLYNFYNDIKLFVQYKIYFTIIFSILIFLLDAIFNK